MTNTMPTNPLPTTRTNQVPVRTANRQLAFDVIDGEREYQEIKFPFPGSSAASYIHLIGEFVAKPRLSDAADLDVLREIAALAVRGMELYGARPREYHVPASANITGEMHAQDKGDALE